MGLLATDLRFCWLAAAFALSCDGQTTGPTCEELMSSAKGRIAEALLDASSACVTDNDCALTPYDLPPDESPYSGMMCIVAECWPTRAMTRAGLGKLEAAVQTCWDECLGRNCPCVEWLSQCAALEYTVFTPVCSFGQCAVAATCDPAHCPAVSQGPKCCVFSGGRELCGADNGQGCVVTP
jgi:hypothetical protein